MDELISSGGQGPFFFFLFLFFLCVWDAGSGWRLGKRVFGETCNVLVFAQIKKLELIIHSTFAELTSIVLYDMFWFARKPRLYPDLVLKKYFHQTCIKLKS